jgi:hypothetical protein
MMVAKKVAEKLCKNKIMFSIRETTKDSKKKTYHYNAIKNKDKLKVVVNKSFVGGVIPALKRYFYLKNKEGEYLTVTYTGNTVVTPTKTDYTITWTDNPNTIWYIYEKEQKEQEEQKEEYSVYMKDADAWYTTFYRGKKGAKSLVYNNERNEWTLGDAMSSVKLVIQGPIVKHPFNEEHNLIIFDISRPPFHLTRS